MVMIERASNCKSEDSACKPKTARPPHPASRTRTPILEIFAIALVPFLSGCRGGCRPTPVEITKAQIPFQNLNVLNKGDTFSYRLPNGREVVYDVRSETLPFCEQTTSSGLKTWRVEPPLEQVAMDHVCTSGADQISVYSMVVDGYRVEVAEDLKETRNLPVIVRVCDQNADEPSFEALRALFDQNAATQTGPPLRVPMGTINHELNQRSDFSTRLAIIDDSIEFDVSDHVHALTEEERLAKLQTIVDCVVQRYEGIDGLTSFSINVLKSDEIVFQYVAQKDAYGQWHLVKR
jgi:hypothetical protein